MTFETVLLASFIGCFLAFMSLGVTLFVTEFIIITLWSVSKKLPAYAAELSKRFTGDDDS